MKQFYRVGLALLLCVCMALSLASCGSNSKTTTTKATEKQGVTIDDVKDANCLGHTGSYADVLDTLASRNPDKGYSYTWSIGFTGSGAPSESSIGGNYTPVTLKWNGMGNSGVLYLYFEYGNVSKNLSLLDVADSSGSVVENDLGTWKKVLIDTLYATYG